MHNFQQTVDFYKVRASKSRSEKRNSHSKLSEPERDIRTAYDQAKRTKIQELKLTSTPIKA